MKNLRVICALVFSVSGLWFSSTAQEKATTKPAQKTSRPATKAKQTKPAKPVSELARLRDEYVAAAKDYKSKLESLLAIYQKNVTKAEFELEKSKDLFSAGLISHKELEASEARVKQAEDSVADVQAKIKNADSQIADTLLEAEAETKIAKSRPLPKGGMMSSASFIRYNGGAAWSLSDAWKVQQFFQSTFKRPLPVAVFGQGSIHDRWRLDHHNAMDVSLQPDGVEGQALLGFLRANGIPFLAFRQAIPGTATGPHIHIGRPSHRY